MSAARTPLAAGSPEVARSREASGALTVRVEDERGAPLVGLVVTVELERGGLLELAARATDAAGRATFERVQSWSQVEVAAEGRVRVSRAGGAARTDGGFEDLVLVYAAVARLSLQLVSKEAGAPLAGARVWVSLARDERRRLRSGEEQRALRGETDADGHVTFDAAPCEHRLEVLIEPAQGALLSSDRVDGAVLLVRLSGSSSDDVAGEPLVLRAGEARAVRAECPSRPALRVSLANAAGVLVDGANGALVRAPSADVWASDDPPRVRQPIAFAEPAGEPGLYDFVPVGADFRGELYLEFWHRADQDAPSEGLIVRVDASQLGLGRLEPLVLRLAPLATIRGAVEGQRHANVRAIPRDPLARLYSRSAAADLHRASAWDGSFETPELLPGEYDLLVATNAAARGATVERFGPFAAGARGVRLESQRAEAGRLTIELEGAGAPDEQVTVCVVRALDDRRTLPRIGGEAARLAVRSSREVPLRDLALVNGSEMVAAFAGGPTIVVERRAGLRGAAHSRALEPGPLLIVVAPLSGSGQRGTFRAASTGWYDFQGGDAQVVMELRPAARVSGTVEGVPHGVDLYGAVITSSGHTATLVGPLDATVYVPVSAVGRFEFEGAPVGSVTLRFGSRTALARGEWTFEARVNLRAGENGPVHVR